MTLDETILWKHNITENKIIRGGYRRNYRNDNFGRGRSKSRDRQFSYNIRRNDKSSSRSRSGSRASTNRDRIRCHKCREHDHLAKDCPTSEVKKRFRANTTDV